MLPIANWIGGGAVDPAYARRWSEWGYGTGICVGVAIIAAILARRDPVRRWFSRRADDAAGAPSAIAAHPDESVFTLATASLMAFALYAGVAHWVFSAAPLLIDELVQLFQARIFESGQLALPVAAHREFFSVLHVVDMGDRVYSQFPPGWPSMLALADGAGVSWMAGPLCGALSVALFARLVRLIQPYSSRAFVLGASALFAAAPFGVFQFSSHMNHGPALMWLLVALVAVGELLRARGPVWGLVIGLALGAAATIRPLDAFAFALPIGGWLLWRALYVRSHVDTASVARARRAFWLSGVGVSIPMLAMFYVNIQTTGSPLVFGYEVLWGKAHGLGFHAAPWGALHTPARGLELLSLYVTRLQTYLFETPFPAVAPAIIALALAAPLGPLDRFLLISSALLGALYFAYWHDGFFLGPRFVFAWLPVLVLWTVRLPGVIRARWPVTRSIEARAALTAFFAAGIVMTVGFSLPVRITQYRSGLTSMRTDYARSAAAAGAGGALVFVRESWGAQLIARLWAVGVSRSATAALYAGVDACLLERGLQRVETAELRGVDAERSLTPLLVDSSRVRSSPWSPDSTEKFLRGARYDAVCVARINQDREGYVHLAPLLLERTSRNLYARDLHSRDSLLLQEHPDRPVFLLRRLGTNADAPLQWAPLRRDSLFAAWRRSEP